MAHVYFRVRDGRIDIKAVSELAINPCYWSCERQGYKACVPMVDEDEKMKLEKGVNELTSLISKAYYRGADGIWLKGVIQEYHHPLINSRSGDKGNMLLNAIRQYAHLRPLSPGARQRLLSVANKVCRYERYKREIVKCRDYALCMDTMTADDLRSFRNFLVMETKLYGEHPELFVGMRKGGKRPCEQSENSLNTIFRRIRTVVNYNLKNQLISNDPFATFEMPKALYGPPFYLTLEERDRVYFADLSRCTRAMQAYRDIFMFQCLIGCRVGDMLSLRKGNIVGDAVEFIAEKTKGQNPRTIRVPLNDKARRILAKYTWLEDRILPKFNVTDYNKNLRKVLSYVGINRKVAVIDLMTRESVMRPLCDVATTHTARKTFIGNLYKKVKDPSLVGALSGHSEGSRAFARYREIDMDIKRELISLIE